MNRDGSEYLSTPTREINASILLPEDVVMLGTETGSQYRFQVDTVTVDESLTGGLKVPSGTLEKVAGGDLDEAFKNFGQDENGKLKVKLVTTYPSLQVGGLVRFVDARFNLGDARRLSICLSRIWQLELLHGRYQMERISNLEWSQRKPLRKLTDFVLHRVNYDTP